MSENTTIWVSKHVKDLVDEVKKRNGHKTHDSLIRYFLALDKGVPCKGEKCIWYWNCMEYGCPKFKEKEEDRG